MPCTFLVLRGRFSQYLTRPRRPGTRGAVRRERKPARPSPPRGWASLWFQVYAGDFATTAILLPEHRGRGYEAADVFGKPGRLATGEPG